MKEKSSHISEMHPLKNLTEDKFILIHNQLQSKSKKVKVKIQIKTKGNGEGASSAGGRKQ